MLSAFQLHKPISAQQYVRGFAVNLNYLKYCPGFNISVELLAEMKMIEVLCSFA